MPQPIETAPRDGTPILTDRGILRWAHYRRDWEFCTPTSDELCQDNGSYVPLAGFRPTLWEPLPDWMQ